jgi:hypothetical protein
MKTRIHTSKIEGTVIDNQMGRKRFGIYRFYNQEQTMPESGKSKNKPRYICPLCAKTFSRLNPSRWPPNVPWYRFQALAQQCPNCGILLKSKYGSAPLPLKLSSIAALIALVLSLKYQDVLMIVWAYFAIIATYNGIMGYREFNDEHAYILDGRDNPLIRHDATDN